jgi:putative FmdB family regulatory protein
MPFYEYECQACKFYTEVMQKISDAPLLRCPSCGKKRLKKLVSAPVFRLKGAGWYETDFKSDKESRRNLVGAEREEPKAEAKAEAKAETKADTKAESKDGKSEAKEVKPATAKPAESAAGGGSGGAGRKGAKSTKRRSARPRRR